MLTFLGPAHTVYVAYDQSIVSGPLDPSQFLCRTPVGGFEHPTSVSLAVGTIALFRSTWSALNAPTSCIYTAGPVPYKDLNGAETISFTRTVPFP